MPKKNPFSPAKIRHERVLAGGSYLNKRKVKWRSKSLLRFIILGFLNYRSMFGYEIKQVMDGSTSFFWQAKLSQIYQTVKVLEEEGLVVSEMEAQSEKPDRKRYTITPKGQEEFFSELNTPLKEISPKKDDLLLKLFFSASKPKKEIQSELLYMKKLHEQQLKIYQTETKEIIQNAKKNHNSKTNDALLWEATRRLGEMYEETYIRWIEETNQIIEKNFKKG